MQQSLPQTIESDNYLFNVPIADTEDDLHRLLHNFHLSCLKFNIKITIHETKAMTVSKKPLSCKLEIDGRMVDQVMEFNNSDVNIASSGNLV